ncbi:MAG: SH3 domain-containing protein [Betaproteobacteria bacterium]
MRRRHPRCALLRAAVACAITVAAATATAADYRVTGEPATVLYDAPSAKARPLFVYGRDVPMEVLVNVEGWTKIRDLNGSIGWVPGKSLTDKRTLQVRVPMADIRANPDDTAPLVFRAEQNVLLDMAEAATSAVTTGTPGWVRVRHRDGQIGFVRIPQVYGF